MSSNNRIILASAGSGKTTSIVDDACSDPSKRSAVVTYTINNTSEIRAKTYARMGFKPENIYIASWYSFMLRHFVRPYQRCLYRPRVARIVFVSTASARMIKESDIPRHFFASPGAIYSDKVSKFACCVIENTKGLPIKRLEEIYDRIFIDESQDLAAYDLNILEHLLHSKVSVTLVGDHRQATYSTNAAQKNKQFKRSNIINIFKKWQREELCNLEYQYQSHRCVQPICDFADKLYPQLPPTKSLNSITTDHDGVFCIPRSEAARYIAEFRPQVLRYNRTQRQIPGDPINFGSSKGMTFDRTLIFPHKNLEKYLLTDRLEDAGKEIAKIYVAVTRARQSSTFVIPDGATPKVIPLFSCGKS